MREKLEILLDELQCLKKEGVHSVYYEDDSLNKLKETVKADSESYKTTRSITTLSSKHEVPANQLSEGSAKASVASIAPTHAKKLNPFSPLPSNDAVNTAKQNTQPHSTGKATIIHPTPKSSIPSIKHAHIPFQIDLPKTDKQSQWHFLKEKVEISFNSALTAKDAKEGSKMIFGTGSLDSDIFICGDSPALEDESEATPFSGQSGQLLTKILQAMGLHRNKLYLAYIMNWRLEAPSHFGERTPTQLEMDNNLPYLKAQIEIVKPKVIVALGATTVNGLLGPDKSRKMGDVRGQWFTFQNTPLMITFHPSYLLRNNTLRTKRLVWEDMMKIMERLEMPISEKQRGFFK